MDNIEPTSSIQDSLDLSELESSSTDLSQTTTELEDAGNQILSEFKAIQQRYSAKITMDAFDSLSSKTNREEYLKHLTAKLYEEMHKAAKRYIKNWCSLNHCRQKWSNPFASAFSARYVKENSAFIPQVYTLSVVNDDGHEKTLAYMARTSREACINGAKLLDFDSSQERAVVFAKIPEKDLNEILTTPSYLKEAEALYVYFEHRRQIENRKYIKSYIRERWSKEVDEEFAKKNGVI